VVAEFVLEVADLGNDARLAEETVQVLEERLSLAARHAVVLDERAAAAAKASGARRSQLAPTRFVPIH
jgi:hypothetical protein